MDKFKSCILAVNKSLNIQNIDVKYQTLFRAQCTKWNYVIINILILKHVLRNVTWWQRFTFSSRLVINQSPFNWVNNYHPLWNIRYFYFKRFDILKSPDWLRWPIAIVFVCLQFYNFNIVLKTARFVIVIFSCCSFKFQYISLKGIYVYTCIIFKLIFFSNLFS